MVLVDSRQLSIVCFNCHLGLRYTHRLAAASSSECWVVLQCRSRRELPSASFSLLLCTAYGTGCNFRAAPVVPCKSRVRRLYPVA